MIISFKDIISRCHQRHKKPLRQRKTVISPAIYKGLLGHFTVYCAYRHPVRLHDLEQANISFMPVGGAPTFDRMPQLIGGDRFYTRQGIKDWEIRLWRTSWGIQVYTGMPSEQDGARWHDLNFKYAAICAAPEAVYDCIETLVSLVENPLLTITKSGGLRFSCRVPHYLHPNTKADRFYIFKDVITPENRHQRNVYLEILGSEGHSPWDARYEILFGDLLAPPVIAQELLWTTIDTLRESLHEPISEIETHQELREPPPIFISLPTLGSQKLDLAKEAMLKRGYTYIRHENDVHHWSLQATDSKESDVCLWEHDDTIWIRASNPDHGLPITDTPITTIWDDTGILPPIDTEIPVSNQVINVREGKLTPLAIKRSNPVLEKREKNELHYETLADYTQQIPEIFDEDTRIAGLIATDTGVRNNYALETHLLKVGAVSFNSNKTIVNEAQGRFDEQNIPSIFRWRRYRHLWDQVKDIPVAERMANPFQMGNVCEDGQRCSTLVSKGADPSETICPTCPVYTICQERGYLSQSAKLEQAKTQLIPQPDIFLNPSLSTFVYNILTPIDKTERLCIIDGLNANELFLDCHITRSTLRKWNEDWDREALGNFAQVLLNTLGIKNGPDDLLVRRIRTVIKAFQPYENEIIRQMRLVNLSCRIVPKKTIDEKNGTELAHYTILFENDVSAYIPIDKTAADRLNELQLPVLQLETFTSDEDTKVQIPIEQAIRLGALDVTTPEKIIELPTTYRNPEWTAWHQLKRFFSHYSRDTDAPMIWYNNCLSFWVPPVLNPNIKQVLFVSPTMVKQELHNVFPDEKIEVTHLNPSPWMQGNHLFQIRTGVYTPKTVLDYNSTWDVIGLSKMGERIIQGMCAEIQRDTNIKHAILTYEPIVAQLKHFTASENVCVTTNFETLDKFKDALEAAQVVWIVGTPFWQPNVIWRDAQILYGNDEKPLCYDADTEFQHYKDPRIQHIYIQRVTNKISEIIGRIGLNRLPDKKVILMSSLPLTEITDRPETLLFDWEDFEIAGNLDKLKETITKRQQFETERDNLTADSGREKVEQVLGCSPRQANRILQQLRGGNIPHVTYRVKILSLLTDGEKKASEVVEAIGGNPTSINNELARLLKNGEIEKVRWGVYALPKQDS